MLMGIEKLTVGQLATNCYLVWEDKKRETIIIDPGDDADFILRRILDRKLNPRAIVATHGHFDHILAVTELKLALDIPFLINEKDLFLLKRARESARHYLGVEVDPMTLPDKFLKRNEEIKFGQEKLKVLETPGHTPGSISLVSKGMVFTGDTLFAEGVGRTDFKYSSKEDLNKSLKKLSKLPGNTLVYPGHGDETTIGKVRFPVNI